MFEIVDIRKCWGNRKFVTVAHTVVCRISIPRREIEPIPPAEEAWVLPLNCQGSPNFLKYRLKKKKTYSAVLATSICISSLLRILQQNSLTTQPYTTNLTPHPTIKAVFLNLCPLHFSYSVGVIWEISLTQMSLKNAGLYQVSLLPDVS